ncbi:hypothetical protein JHW43_006131 [Diplocarpon mali]|nr:hypothetical protein JHW43_006131 [Diplocarpon mali]
MIVFYANWAAFNLDVYLVLEASPLEVMMSNPGQHCDGPGCDNPAERPCAKCADTPPIPNSSYQVPHYCCDACGHKHKAAHRAHCELLQQRKKLFRIGGLLQEIVYRLRERLFSHPISSVEVRDGRIVVYEPTFQEDAARKSEVAMDLPGGLALEEKRTLLAWNYCGPSVAWMYDTMVYLTARLRVGVEEHCFEHQSSALVSVYGAELDTKQPSHVVTKITIAQSQEEYALDLTGAQYGYREPVMPWSAYITSKIAKFVSRSPPGEVRVGFLRLMHFCKHPVLTINYELSSCILPSVIRWELERGLAIGEMLLLPQDKYERRQLELVDFVDEGLRVKMLTIGDQVISQETVEFAKALNSLGSPVKDD